jgi:hypothetical protein
LIPVNRLARTAVGALLVTLVLPAATAFAEPVNPGVRIGEWIYTNVTALFAPLLAAVALYFLAKRQFTQFLSFAVFAVLVAIFVFAGADFKDAAVGLGKWIIGR